MKKLSWKFVAAACGACLLLFSTSAHAALGKQLLKFDTLGDGSAVPFGYGAVNWFNFYSLDAVNYDSNPSGYEAGMKSVNNVLYNGGGSPSAIYSATFAFILNSAYLTGAWNDSLHVTVTGYYNGIQVYTFTKTLSATQPTLVTFPSKLVNEVDFVSFGGTPHEGYPGGGEHFATDNVTLTVLPIPARSFSLHIPD